MPSADSKVQSARMSRDTWEIVRKEMEEEGITFSRWVRNKAEGMPSKEFDEEVVDSLRMSAKCYGLTLNEFLEKINNAVDDGDVVYEEGKFFCYPEIDTTKFKEACDAKGLPYQSTLNKAARMVLKAED